MKKIMNYTGKVIRSFFKIGAIWWFIYMVYYFADMCITYVFDGWYVNWSPIEWAMMIWLTGISAVITIDTIGDWFTNIELWIKSKRSEDAA